ncbi:MAG: hypothetical protein GX589_06155 [Deltaproteobacteria bacterium]|nr:hypothetical protein [Deltaproteobacteria bacterium]
MLFAYMLCSGLQSEHAELCLIPERPDQFSVPVRIESLEPTEAAVFRVGPTEAITVKVDPHDRGLIIEPFPPTKIHITPDLPQYPGVNVKKLKVLKLAERSYRTLFQQEKDRNEEWREWVPYRDK